MMTLKRISGTGDGTFGVLMEGEVPFALTVERPWLQNRRNVSCIPPGRYVCRRTLSPRFGETFEVTGVPGRSHILFHKGNTAADSSGCIVVGERFGELGGTPAVLSSARAFGAFMGRLGGRDEFTLLIEEV